MVFMYPMYPQWSNFKQSFKHPNQLKAKAAVTKSVVAVRTAVHRRKTAL